MAQLSDPQTVEDSPTPLPVLDVKSASKSFGPVRALRSVDLDVLGGEVHAVVGQNGSGKSTLVKVLSGFYHADDDRTVVKVGGIPVRLTDTAASYQAGLRFVHQELGLVPTLNAIENLALGGGFLTGFAGRIRWKQERHNAQARLRALGYSFDIQCPVSELRPSERTGIAIARALASVEDTRVLVLDEPTASLPLDEVRHLFDAIARIGTFGIGVIYISHRLDEIFEIADRVTVLRDGERVATNQVSDIGQEQLISLMVGGEHLRFSGASEAPRRGATVFEVQNVCGPSMSNVSFSAAAGEVLGIAGLTGSGRDELLALLFGGEPRIGLVQVNGRTVSANSPRAAMAAGMALVPPDRHRQGSIVDLTVTQNCTITDLKRHSGALGFLRSRDEQAEVRTWIDTLDVRPTASDAVFAALSGGNQQKIVLAKWLRLKPKVLLLDEPTQGVDVHAKSVIHKLARQAANDGSVVVVASSDELELCDLCDRVLVLRDGEIVGELHDDLITPDEIARLEF